MDEPARRRGRPPGAKNKPIADPEPNTPLLDYRHADPDALISRQMGLIDWAQQALRWELQCGLDSKEKVSLAEIQKLEKLSNSLVKALDSLRKSADIAEEMAARMTPEQLLDAAIRKVEGQDIATLNYAIRRLRAHRERLGTETTRVLGEATIPATDAIASLNQSSENE